ncbi:MAG TPA: dihydroorotase [Phycisphaerales bacterium]|nr:dihydroorotase [Phycisphaerales bacterium]
MSSLLIAGGRAMDPASGLDRQADVAIEAGFVVAIGPGLDPAHADEVLDARGCLVTPGLIDPHVHLREPGREEAETIASGTAAAVMGGFTTVCCMPNTTPALDDDAMVEFVYRQTERTGRCRVFPVGAVSKGRQGQELAQIGLMARAGAVGFTDDGDCVASAGLMLRALQYIRPTGLALMQHCQEPTLTAGAHMHAGAVATRLGLGGWPRVAEELIVERDVRLNRAVGCRYHAQHLSSGGSVEIVRRARAEGQPVSAEVAPHHLLLEHDEVARHGGYWTDAKMNPPLRERGDIEALRAGVADGTITVLATDHAPHTPDSKQLQFDQAPFGIVGLETALSLYHEALVATGLIPWMRLIELMTLGPARLCGFDRPAPAPGAGLGRLAVGGPGDVTVIDPDAPWTIRTAEFAGRSRNTPFDGRSVRARAVATVVAGRVRYEAAPGTRLRGKNPQRS